VIEFSDQPLEPFGKVLVDQSIPSELALKTALVHRVIKMLRDAGHLPSYGTGLAELAVEEALANALVHGNKLDATKEVRVIVFGDDKRFGVIIEDQGQGFTAEKLPNTRDPENLLSERGRGIHLISHYMDLVRFSGKGNRVMLVRGRQTEPDNGALPPPPETGHAVQVTGPLDVSDFSVSVQTTQTRAKANVSDAVAHVPLPDEIDLTGQTGHAAATRKPEDAVIELVHEGGAVIALVHTTRISEDNAQDVKQRLADAQGPGKPIVLDLSAVGFMSSIGIGIITSLLKQTKASGTKLAIHGVQPAIAQVFKLTSLNRLLPIEPDRAAAMKRVLGNV
jgi:serine/threonine-protein kinase RsbW